MSKVGDTLTATVAPAGATVTYSWAIGGKEYATSESITVPAGTEAGTEITLTVTSADGQTATATATVIDGLAILDADQTGAKEVALTFNADIDADDVITVNKGNKAVKIDSTTYSEKSAVITLADKIVDKAEYTVTLTPANGDDPTSVTFIGEVASLGEIVFLNDVLVMSDSNYDKGYCYVKGYDQYGDEINLSGLTVTPGVGQFESYDPKTGKITIDSNRGAGTSPFMTIKEVPVFVQYQNGTTILSAQENLKVSTRAYLSDMEFGEIKKDGTPRDDGRLTITELSSKKYYIEILNPTDQYGNALDAEDLNDQKDIDKVLFVIPGNTGAFYKTGQFATLGDKTILWLEDAPDLAGRSKPGTMALTITGAGGNTFTTDVTIEDDPYIQTLNVTYPGLYADVAASDELGFTAVDQYGNEVDLYDFVPHVNAQGALEFDDLNNMSNKPTTISISGAAFNDVSKNAGKRTFKSTINTTGVDKGSIVTFVVTTAGMQVSTASVTVAGEGTAAKIKTDGKSNQLLGNVSAINNGTAIGDYDFNAKLQFEDANGNTMKRSDKDYPKYSDAVALTLKPNNNAFDLTQANFYWTLASSKLTTNDTPDTTGIANTAAAAAPNKGKFTAADMEDATEDVWVILWAEQGADAVLLDQQSFHFTQVVGTAEKYTAACADTLYVKKRDDGYKDSVTVKVTAKTDKGETYEVPAANITLGGIPFNTDGNNVVYGDYDLDEVGTKTATVFVNGEEETAVKINYTNAAPVPTKVDYSGKATGGNTRAVSKFGTNPSVDAPEEVVYAGGGAIAIVDGVLTFTGANALGDTLTAKIVDQYGQTVTTTKFKANGEYIEDGDNLSAEKEIIEYAAGAVQGRFTIINSMQRRLLVTATYTGATTAVTTQAELLKALKAAAASDAIDTIEVAADVALNAAITIPENDELVIPYGITVTSTKAVVNNGTIRGSEAVGENDDTTSGHFTINGATIIDNPALTNNGTIDLPGDSLELIDAIVTGTGIISGNIIIDGTVIFDADSDQSLVSGTTITMADGAASLTIAGEVAVVGDIEGSTAAATDKITLVASDNTETELDTDNVASAMTLSDTGAQEKPEVDDGEALVGTAYDFINAINVANTIILAGDIDLSESAIAKNIFTEDTTIDLNGFELTVAEDHSIWVSGATLTLTDSSESNDGDLIGSTDQSAITAMNNGLYAAALVVDGDCLGTNASLGTYFFADQQGAAKPTVTLKGTLDDAKKIKASAFSTVVELNSTEMISALNGDDARAAAPVVVYVGELGMTLTNSNSTWTAGATTANKEYRADLTVTVPGSV